MDDMIRDDIRVVWVLATCDISTAPGTTEPYYLVRKFAEHWETHVFAPLSKPIESVYQHQIPIASIAAAILFNTVLIPYFIWWAIRKPPDLVYAYRNIFFPVLIAELFTDATIVYDIRADPYAQAKEFEEHEDSQSQTYHLLLRITRRLHRFMLPRADGVVTLSEALADRLHSNYGVPQDKIGIIPLAVDPDEFTPKKGNEDFFKVVYVGALREFRGINNLVRALTALEPELRQQVQLELYGGADEEYIQSLRDIAQDKLSINWYGHVAHDQLACQVATCDVAASPLPPLDSFEVSSPAKIYEYLALGLPIVATDITPHKRILTEECSMLIPTGNTRAMSDAFEKLLSDTRYKSELSGGARRLALENTWTNRFEELCERLDEWT